MYPVKKLSKIHGIDKIIKIGNLYISSQPDLDALDWIKAQGIAKVINLRDSNEANFEDEQNKCKELGIEYYQFPITSNGHYLLENIKTLNSIVENKNNDYLIHCGTGNRVLAWLLIYFPSQKILSFKDSKELILNLGFSSDTLLNEAIEINYQL